MMDNVLSTVEILNNGMQCLTEKLGIVEAERFISVVIREQFDYTKWQRDFYDSMKPGEFHSNAVEYAKTHPYNGKALRL